MKALDKCQLCKYFIPSSKEGRMAHMKKYHNVVAVPLPEHIPLNPAKKAEIVQRIERKLKEYLILPDDVPKLKHGAECRCMLCFEKTLDALVESSERMTKEAAHGRIGIDVADTINWR